MLGPGVLRLVVHEGRYRQVRRMCEAVGHPVRRLVRTRIGPLSDTGWRRGGGACSSAAEVRALAVRRRRHRYPRRGHRRTPKGSGAEPVERAAMAPALMVRGLRGATTVDEDTVAQVTDRSRS